MSSESRNERTEFVRGGTGTAMAPNTHQDELSSHLEPFYYLGPPKTSTSTSTPPPISSLPTEILLKIFGILWSTEKGLYHCDRVDQIDTRLYMQLRRMPDSLANVCRYWDEVCAMESAWWFDSYILIGLRTPGTPSSSGGGIIPSPAHRLRRHFTRNKNPESLRIKLWTTDTPYHLGLSKGTSRLAELVKRYGASWPAQEKALVAECMAVVRENMLRVGSFSVSTIYSDSLPDVAALFGVWEPGECKEVYRFQAYAETNNNPLVAGNIPPITRPATEASGALPVQSWTYPDVYIPTQLSTAHIFPLLWDLILSGKAFVSFCRFLLSNEKLASLPFSPSPSTATSPNLDILGKKDFDLTISHVRPEDGGLDSPFTLLEFLNILRMFCGRLAKLNVTEVVLPLSPSSSSSTSPLSSSRGTDIDIQTFPFPECTAPQHLHPRPHIQNSSTQTTGHLLLLRSATITHCNPPVFMGIYRILYPHLKNRDHDDLHSNSGASNLNSKGSPGVRELEADRYILTVTARVRVDEGGQEIVDTDIGSSSSASSPWYDNYRTLASSSNSNSSTPRYNLNTLGNLNEYGGTLEFRDSDSLNPIIMPSMARRTPTLEQVYSKRKTASTFYDPRVRVSASLANMTGYIVRRRRPFEWPLNPWE